MEWIQEGYALVSKAICNKSYLPVVHGFSNAEWEMGNKMKDAEYLRPEQREDLQIVKAKLVFTLKP